MSASSVAGQCSLNINSTSFVPTTCTAFISGTSVMINFTNPFVVDANLGTVFIAKVSSIFTNPYSTRPTSSFGIYTFHSNGSPIDYIDYLKSIQMNITDSFQSLVISRASQKNYDITTYTFTLKQKSPL